MDEEEDDYISYGTPLPEIEDEATLKKKAAKELQVRDERGRQRFHGAFTGGFSAGYFNTVGTKEGWNPSTFISSRSNVADHVQQNPEDFMDDEDFGEFGIATRRIHTTSNFQDDSQLYVKKRKLIHTDDVIPGEAPLKVIVQPVRESIGIQILKKLGWRHGQGIGPRMKKQSTFTKVYGCVPFSSTDMSEEDDPMALSFTFAPKDIEAAVYKPKDNYFGLAYIGLSKKSILSSHTDLYAQTSTKSWLPKDKKKLTITGHAFGVGAFEDDDDDIYSKDDLAQYDFSELSSKVFQNSPNVNVPKKLKSYTDVIEGYCLASQPPTVKKYYPAPALPSNFKPIYLKLADNETSKINLQRFRPALSASDRSLILGENFFKKTSTNEIATMNTAKKEAVPEKTGSQTGLSTTIPLKFRPFPNDIGKQQRYEEYLKLKTKGDIGNLVQPSSMTEWEKQQEIEEFSKAAVLFKPLSNVLSSRFESKSHLSVEHEVIAELEKIKREKEIKTVPEKKILIGSSNRKTFEWYPASLLCKRMNVPNPYPNSNSSGTQSIHKGTSVFDHLFFTTEKSLSCKQDVIPLTSDHDIDSKLNEISKDMSNEPPPPGTKLLDRPISPQNEKAVSLSENKKPSIDLFKDIFENSSDDDDDSEVDVKFDKNDKNTISSSEVKIIEYEAVEKLSVPSYDTASLNVIEKSQKRNSEDNIKSQNSSIGNKKVGFGVFANLDLDAINQRKPQDRSVQTNKLSCENNKGGTNHMVDKISNEIQTDDMYGPELPPNFSGDVSPVFCTNKVEDKKYDKHKSKHKHKHHKHKSKKKKKRKSLRRDSESSELSDEIEDVPPTLIIEKLIKLQKRES